MDSVLVFEKWLRGQNIADKITLYDFSDMPQFFGDRIKEIQKLAETDPDAAYANLLQVVGFINTVTAGRPDILGKLLKLVEDLKGVLQTITEKKKAFSFTISAGFPVVVSISISWKMEQHLG